MAYINLRTCSYSMQCFCSQFLHFICSLGTEQVLLLWLPEHLRQTGSKVQTCEECPYLWQVFLRWLPEHLRQTGSKAQTSEEIPYLAQLYHCLACVLLKLVTFTHWSKEYSRIVKAVRIPPRSNISQKRARWAKSSRSALHQCKMLLSSHLIFH